MTTQLAFHAMKFTPIVLNNQIWLSSKELAQALKYASTKSVTDIYNKNQDEFTDGMSQVVESTTSGNYRKKARFFSLRGAHLIAMFARTPVAKEFRRWVLDILDKEVGQPITQPIPPTPQDPTDIYTFCDNYANRIEMIYYQEFKPIFCRTLSSDEIVMSHESMKEWLEKQGLIFFTRDELKNLSYRDFLAVTDS